MNLHMKTTLLLLATTLISAQLHAAGVGNDEISNREDSPPPVALGGLAPAVVAAAPLAVAGAPLPPPPLGLQRFNQNIGGPAPAAVAAAQLDEEGA
jgi:hypothetical protein